jgi:hypothetical protein
MSLSNLLFELKFLFEEQEPELEMVAQYTPDFEQIMDVRNRPYEPDTELAKLMAPDLKGLTPEVAYAYAYNVIKDPFPEGEAVIAKDPGRAYYYAKDIIKDPFPEGESAIAKDPERSYRYAKYIIKGRWPKGEAAIAKYSRWATLYAAYVIKDPFPEGESAIATDPGRAYAYAKDVIKDPEPSTWAERYKAGN